MSLRAVAIAAAALLIAAMVMQAHVSTSAQSKPAAQCSPRIEPRLKFITLFANTDSTSCSIYEYRDSDSVLHVITSCESEQGFTSTSISR